MKLLPYDTFTIETPDPLMRVVERLSAQIQPPRGFSWSSDPNHTPYEGTISETGFKINRIIDYRNSFLPMIRGEFEHLPTGTLVRIKMGLHPFVIAFVGLWYLIWYSALIPICLAGVMSMDIASLFLGMPTAILLVFWCAFWYEANRSHGELEKIILGQISQGETTNNSQQLLWKSVQWILTIIGTIFALWQIFGQKIFPANQTELRSLTAVSCSQHPTVSPYCHFSVVRTLTGHPTAATLAISADGKTLVTGGTDKTIKVWNLKTGQLQKAFQSDSGRVLAVAIANDGKTIISGSADHMVRIWQVSQKKPLMLSGHSDDVNFVGITPDGKTLISSSYGAIKKWDLATGKLTATLPNIPTSETNISPLTMINDEGQRVRPLAINSDTNTAILGFLDGVKVWDLNTNQLKFILSEKFDGLSGNLLSAYISLDGKLAALQYSNSLKKFETRLKIWDLTTGKVKAEGNTFFSHNMFADVPLAFSRDRIFGTINQQLKVWNPENAQLEAVVDTESISYFVVSPDGKLLVGIVGDGDTQNSQIKVWELR